MKIVLIIFFFFMGASSYAQVSQEWARYYNPFDTLADHADAMVTDGTGNVYITGTAGTSVNNFDYFTIKYNSTGEIRWIRTYNSDSTRIDQAVDIAVDGSGNVYVTGTGNSNYQTVLGYDIVTIKYDSAGFQQWAVNYTQSATSKEEAFAIDVDNSGNVYVTGSTQTTDFTTNDYVTIKYSPGGIQQWLRKYNGPGNNEDEATAIGIDPTGNIIVTGYSIGASNYDYATIKYSPSGDSLWVRRYHYSSSDKPISLSIDSQGNIAVTGTSQGLMNDHATVKYSPAGVQQWVQRYDFDGTNDEPIGVKFDNQGNVIVAGYSHSFFGGDEYLTIKYGSSGNVLWQQRYGSHLPSNETPRAMTLDKKGNIYFTGQCGPSSNLDHLTLKYSPSGFLQWAIKYNGPSNFQDYAAAIAADDSGNVYVAGASYYSAIPLGYSSVIVKYASLSEFEAQFNRSNLNLPIGDNQSAQDTIDIGYNSTVSYTVSDVNIRIDSLIHTNDSDLELYLIHNGVTDTLIYQSGGSGDNIINTLLNDSASAPVSGGTAPFTGSYKPYKPLSKFNGMDVNGVWVLKVYDRATGNTGTLKAWSLNFEVMYTVGIHNVSSVTPHRFSLHQNYPNPFNPVTKIKFEVPSIVNRESSIVSLSVFDVSGRRIALLVNEVLKAGSYEYIWDAAGQTSGIYFYRLSGAGFSEVKKMVLIK